MREAAELARNPRGAMIAPAGYGKTHVIATAVAKYGGGRELILTHTHAGVDALRGRLARMGVPAKAYHLDTIAGWALRLAAAFPGTSRLPTTEPRTNEEYSGVYVAAAYLLGLRPIREIIRASYSGGQACNSSLHCALPGTMFDARLWAALLRRALTGIVGMI